MASESFVERDSVTLRAHHLSVHSEDNNQEPSLAMSIRSGLPLTQENKNESSGVVYVHI
jgi:hypothetical protein